MCARIVRLAAAAGTLCAASCDRQQGPPQASPPEALRAQPTAQSRPPFDDVAEAGVAMRLDITFRLEPEFATLFPGTSEESAQAVRAKAFVEGDPGDSVKLTVRADKRALSGHFQGVAAIQNQARVAGVLRNTGCWKMPGMKEPSRPAPNPAQEAARAKSLSYSHALLQLGNQPARQAALDEMAAALGGEDTTGKLAALGALGSASQIQFDRARFHQLVLPLLSDATPAVRAAAAGALLSVEPAPEDLGKVLSMVDDPAAEVRNILPLVIQRVSKGDLTGEASGAILKLLDTSPSEERRSFLSSLWGSKYSTELEARLVSMATPFNGREAYDVMYYSLSTQQNKGQKTVDVLIECLANPDQVNVGHRALWGLGYGVIPEQQPRVADAALDFFTVRSTGRDECLRILANYGTASHAGKLATFAQTEGVAPELRGEIDKTVAAIRDRPAPP